MSRPSRPWFRFYVEAVHDRKLRRQKPEHRWLFVACLAAARQSPLAGYLLISERDAMTVEDLADFAGMSSKEVAKGMGELERVGIVATDSNLGAWFLPNWNDRQYESDDVTARTRKHRERSQEQDRNVPRTVVGTPPETEADTETEAEVKQISVELVLQNGASPAVRPVDAVFEAWQEATGHRKAVLDPKRRRVISTALKHYSVPDLVDAVRGVTLSGFHNGQNDNGSRYDDLCLILRDAEHIEKFRDLARDGPRMPVSANMAMLAKVVADRESR